MNEAQKHAFEHHKMHSTQRLESFKVVIAYASEGIKALQICHGGALTATLAVTGTYRSNNPIIPDAVGYSYWCFGIGLVLALVIWLFVYAAQYSYFVGGAYEQMSFEHPYIRETEKSLAWERAGDLFRFAAILLACSSTAFFAVGLWHLRGVFSIN